MRPAKRVRRVVQGIRIAVALGLPLLFATTALSDQKAMIHDAWVREAPRNAMAHAGYLTVMNPGKNPIHLVGAASPQYGKVEIHLSKVVSGVATMVRQEQLSIAPGGALALKPGSFHVMLMKPKAVYEAGDTIKLTLHFLDGGSVTLDAPVRRSATLPMPHKHHKMN